MLFLVPLWFKCCSLLRQEVNYKVKESSTLPGVYLVMGKLLSPPNPHHTHILSVVLNVLGYKNSIKKNLRAQLPFKSLNFF